MFDWRVLKLDDTMTLLSDKGGSGRGTLSVHLALSLVLLAVASAQGIDSCQFHQPDTSVQCESIQYEGCQDLSVSNSHINTTSFPNVYDHLNQEEARRELERSQLLLTLENLTCSSYARLLVCSAFYPLCFPGLFQKVEPCREMCEDVRDSCSARFQEVTGQSWPDFLQCDHFHPFGSQLCILNETSCGTVTAPSSNPSPPGTGTSPTTTASGVLATTSNPACLGRLVNSNKSQSAFAGATNCAEPCEGVYFEEEQSALVSVWSTAISLLTLVVSILIVITYLLNYRTIHSLEAPIYYISLCYGFVGFMNLVSVAVGREAVLCDPTVRNSFNQSILVSQGLTSPVCSTLFSVSYYFTVCGWSWWAVLTLQWAVCSVKSETLSRHWNLSFHALAWGTPFVFLLVALITGSLSGDPITQSCWVRKDRGIGFLLVPLGLVILFCAILSVTVQARVVQLQNAKLKEIRNGTSVPKTPDYVDPSKLLRIGIYITFCIIPMGVLFSTYFYDHWYRGVWERSYLLSCAASGSNSLQDCDSVPDGSKPLSQVFMARVFAGLCMGFVSVFWLLRQQLLLGWKRLCCAVCTLGGLPTNRQNQYGYANSAPSPATTPSSADMGVADAVALATGRRSARGGEPRTTSSATMGGLEMIQVLSSSPQRARTHSIQVAVGRDSRLEPAQVLGRNSRLEPVQAMNRDSRLEPVQVMNRESRLEPVQVLGRDSRLEPVQAMNRDSRLEPVQVLGRDSRLEPVQTMNRDSRLEPVQVLGRDSRLEPVQVLGRDSRLELVYVVNQDNRTESAQAMGRESRFDTIQVLDRDSILDPLPVTTTTSISAPAVGADNQRLGGTVQVVSSDSESGVKQYHRTRYLEPRRSEPIRIQMESGTESQV